MTIGFFSSFFLFGSIEELSCNIDRCRFYLSLYICMYSFSFSYCTAVTTILFLWMLEWMVGWVGGWVCVGVFMHTYF
jgi:hypothetical protein